MKWTAPLRLPPESPCLGSAYLITEALYASTRPVASNMSITRALLEEGGEDEEEAGGDDEVLGTSIIRRRWQQRLEMVRGWPWNACGYVGYVCWGGAVD